MDALKFPIEEEPSWREPGLKSTTMLQRVCELTERYDSLPEKAREFCRTAFAKGMAIQYVHQSNVGESVGTQEFEDTLALLRELQQKEKACATDRGDTPAYKRQTSSEQRESINTCLALKKFHEHVQKEMRATGMLTVQVICDVHEVILDQLHPNNGKLREDDVYTETGEGIHFYPKAERAEQLFYALIDHHNLRMEYYATRKEEMKIEERVGFLIRCAARLLFEFVDAHPFSDGNGRMCRLLANYVVSLITPFPVAVYHSRNRSKGSHRGDYIRAIVKCRENPREGPRDLAAMILEGMYLGWDSLFKNLTALNLLEPGEQLGPIVVRKSDPQSLDKVLKRLESGLSKHEGVTIQHVTEIVQSAIAKEDVSSLEPLLQYKSIPVDVDKARGLSIVVHIYP